MSVELTIKDIIPNGDCSVILRFMYHTDVLSAIHLLAANFMRNPMPGLTNVVPAKDSITLVFSTSFNQLSDNSLSAIKQEVEIRTASFSQSVLKTRVHEIPVCYDARLAMNLQSTCQQLGLSLQQLIDCHSQAKYQVDMLGFLPGFAYLSGNHPQLQITRKQTPSIHVSAGSIAIADQQTGIYSLASPGGWHVIGRTPIHLLDWQQQQPMLLKPMDQVSFKAISWREYKQMVTVNAGN